MPKGIDVDIAGIKGLRNRLKGLGASKEVTEALRARLADAWELGAAAFIRAALQHAKLHVDTGMSAATFLALSRAVKRNRVEAIVKAVVRQGHGFQKGIPTFPDGARRSGFQEPATGEALGERAYILKTPEAGDRFFVFQFSFQTVSWQMAFNDPNVEALTAGIEAMEARVAREFEQRARFVLDAFFRGRSIPKQGIGQ